MYLGLAGALGAGVKRKSPIVVAGMREGGKRVSRAGVRWRRLGLKPYMKMRADVKASRADELIK